MVVGGRKRRGAPSGRSQEAEIEPRRAAGLELVPAPKTKQAELGTEMTVHESGHTASLEGSVERLKRIAAKPEEFFRPSDGIAQELTDILRKLYKFAKDSEKRTRPFGPLDELLVEGVDCESIWAQLQLRNAPMLKYTRRSVSQLLKSEDISLAADLPSDDSEDDQKSAENLGDDDKEEEEDEDTDSKNMDGETPAFELDSDEKEGGGGERVNHGRGERRQARKRDGKKGGVKDEVTQDGFFDWDEMERFADGEGEEEDEDKELGEDALRQMYGVQGLSDSDEEEGDEEEEGGLPDKIDGLEDREEDEEMETGGLGVDGSSLGGGLRHSDFFSDDGSEYVKPKAAKELKERKNLNVGVETDDQEDEEEEEEEEEEEGLTRHGEEEKRMCAKVKEMEDELLAEKPWALRGEIRGKERPQNSLLEAAVAVDRVTRVPPPPTAERTLSLLEMIKKRCIDGNWDDVTPRNVEGPQVRKEAPELSQEKSKEGLAEIYEKEFMKTTMGVEEDDPNKDLKKELKRLFVKLNRKLDSLCNFHYTPKPIIPEITVQADVAAIAMEEVLPTSVADAEALAPEEVYNKKRGRKEEFLEDEEMNQADRKRARGSKKSARRKARRQEESQQKLVAKLNPGLGNKYEKAKMMRDIQSASNVISGDDLTSASGKEFSTSGKFFAKMQETVREGVKKAGQELTGAKGQTGKRTKAAQLRL